MLLLVFICALYNTVNSQDVCNGTNPCSPGICKDAGGRVKCICPLGYKEGDDVCEDVNECAKPKSPCGRNSKCDNTVGGYICSCWKKYYWDGYECVRKGTKECPGAEFPSFLVKPTESVRLEIGQTLQLECVGAGKPMPNVYWTKGPNRDRLGPMSVGRSSFYLPVVEKKDIDTYECVIEDCCSGRIARAKVDVSVPSEPCTDPKLKMFGMVWEHKTWDNALAFCQSKGLTLGVIKNAEDRRVMRQDAWRSFTVNANAKKFANQYWLWIGVTDQEEENKFTGLSGEAVEAKWYPGTPDNWDILDEEGQDVVAIHRLTAHWDDSYAFLLRPFACQCPASRQ